MSIGFLRTFAQAFRTEASESPTHLSNEDWAFRKPGNQLSHVRQQLLGVEHVLPRILHLQQKRSVSIEKYKFPIWKEIKDVIKICSSGV